MTPRLPYRIAWHATNVLLLLTLLGLAWGLAWEYSTRRYLQGFADAVVPLEAAPKEKADAILAWMGAQQRRTGPAPELLFPRDPANSLNYRQLLQVCGSATNAFVNLADVSGLNARRLLLLDEQRVTKHVLAELYLDNRWVVVDPSFHAFLQDARGRLLTREELRDPVLWREATAPLVGYQPIYTFERTAHVRLRSIPLVGRWLRGALDMVLPGWEEKVNWTLVVERPSLALTLASGLLLLLSIASRFALGWYADSRLGIKRERLRDRLAGAWRALGAHAG